MKNRDNAAEIWIGPIVKYDNQTHSGKRIVGHKTTGGKGAVARLVAKRLVTRKG